MGEHSTFDEEEQHVLQPLEQQCYTLDWLEEVIMDTVVEVLIISVFLKIHNI